MNRIGVVIADGVGFRNFIMSDFINQLEDSFDEIIIYSGLPIAVFKDLDSNKIKLRELEIYKESKKSWVYRKLKEVAHMKLHISFFGIKCSYNNGNPKKINSKRTLLTKIVYLLANVFHSERNIVFFEKLQYKSFSKSIIFNSYKKMLKDDAPKHLFFTHQRPFNIAPLLGAAKLNNISSSSFIFSWDNLASKGRMLGEFDYYLVWSELMKEELLYFYPKTGLNKVLVVGTPQFEPYVMDKYKVDKESFYKRLDLDINKKIIYYSCGDVSTSRLDPLYIETIAKAIKENKILDSNFIVRTSPAEDETRFVDLKKDFPSIIWNFPDWKLTRENHTETWSQRVPAIQDLKDLRGLLSYSDVNINMCSTMSLDIMIFDKPVINSVFGNKNNGLYNDQKYLNYVHYDKVVNSGAVVVAKNEEELVSAINVELETPQIRANNRKELLKLEIGKPLQGTSKRIVAALKDF